MRGAHTDRMGECCDRAGYQQTFGNRFARRMATRYRKKGLNRTQRRLVEFLTAGGIEGASILEIGGGVGDLQVELLGRGAATVTNLEISDAYEAQAAELLGNAGVAERVTRRLHDIATAPDDVEPADVVVLHRVVCCYPDYERLLTAAGSHALRLLVFSHPPRNLLTRTVIGWDNLLRRLRRNDFRAFVHPPEAMIAAVRAQGLTLQYRYHGPAWDVVGFGR
jgi:16S rRNA G966 N2-methylase RsmD